MPYVSAPFLILFLCRLFVTPVAAQQLYPVRIGDQWGLIDRTGRQVISPRYSAVGETDAFGYTSIQTDEGVGLLLADGEELFPPIYQDIQVLDSLLYGIMAAGKWRVVDRNGRTVLAAGYDRVRSAGKAGLLFYFQDGYWGAVNADGTRLLDARYDEIELSPTGDFALRSGDFRGLARTDGRVIVPPRFTSVDRLGTNLVLVSRDGRSGGYSNSGQVLFPAEYQQITELGDNYLLLRRGERLDLFSRPLSRLIVERATGDFGLFSEHYLSLRIGDKLGLITTGGTTALPVAYQEIQPFLQGLFRVKIKGGWGLIGGGEEIVLPCEYEYISPLRGGGCILRRNDKFGLANYRGEIIQPCTYDRIELEEDGRVRAFTGPANGAAMTALQILPDGSLTEGGQFTAHFRVRVAGGTSGGEASRVAPQDPSSRLLPDFEWFYAAETGRWGLRRRADGGVVIEPVFQSIEVDELLGITLVGIRKSTELQFERTNYRAEQRFGLLLNATGMLVNELDFLDVRLDDWREGNQVARVIFTSGRHGLIDRQGRIVRRDLAYVGNFVGGRARISIGGYLSGSLSQGEVDKLGSVAGYLRQMRSLVTPTDYTAYDQQFIRDATLLCADCKWGYLDGSGNVIVPPLYESARDFDEEIGRVKKSTGWGALDSDGREILDFVYDEIAVGGAGGPDLLRLGITADFFGLIDTLGRLIIPARYNEFGSPHNGIIGMRVGNRWGFLRMNGDTLIPPRFMEVGAFGQGLAAFRADNRQWGFVNQRGDTIISPAYRAAGRFHANRAWVQYADQTFAYIDRSGRKVIPQTFPAAEEFSDFGVARVREGTTFGLIDTLGNWVLRPRYPQIRAFTGAGVAVVRFDGRADLYGLINYRGELLTSREYREVGVFAEGLAVVKDQRGRYGYIDASGREIIPCQFGGAEEFSDGRAIIRENGRCGYIDYQGNIIIAPVYGRCRPFSGERAVVYQGIRNAGIIDLIGNHLVTPSLNRLLDFQEGRGLMRDDQSRFFFITEKAGLYDGYYEDATAFQNGVARVRSGGRWGLVSRRGIELLRPKYAEIGPFVNGYARVRIEGRYGLADRRGGILLPADYAFVEYAGGGLYRVESDGRIGYVDEAGKRVW